MGKVKSADKVLIWLCIGIIAVLVIGRISMFRILKIYLNQRDKEYVALIDDEEIKNWNDIGNLSLFNLNVSTQKDIVYNYLNDLKQPFIYIESICVGFEIALIIVFIIVMRHKQRQKLLRKVNQFSLEQEKIINEDELVNEMYECMQVNIDDKIKEYQSMNSYLAHEQKNFLGILYTKYSNQNDTKSLEVLKKINESIEDFLTVSDFSKEHMERVDVCIVAAEVCDSYSEVYTSVEFLFEEEKDYEIIAKHRWIYRAISNLVDNAIKYGNGKPVRVLLYQEHGCVLVKVEDSGRGISEKQIDNIWKNRFRESDMSNDGYGIGLSLVAHVCDLCDGSYYVQSEESVGSTFLLSFPVAE